jgi:putative PIN family toxin of toxin-antitoxin system
VKVVLDTNVLLAAFATRGLCEAVLEACLASHEIVVSEHILDELRRHLTGKLRVPADQADETVDVIREHAVVVQPTVVPDDACSDRDDLPVLGTAVAGQADCIVTGDSDLLMLERFGAILVLSPRAFHGRLSV